MTATSTYERIRTQAAELCEERHIRPIDDPDAIRSLIADLVRQHQTEAHSGYGMAFSMTDDIDHRLDPHSGNTWRIPTP